MNFKVFKNQKWSQIKDQLDDPGLDQDSKNTLLLHHQIYVCQAEDSKGYDVGQYIIVDEENVGNRLAWFPHLRDSVKEAEYIDNNFISPVKGWSMDIGKYKQFFLQVSKEFDDEFGGVTGSGSDYSVALLSLCREVLNKSIDKTIEEMDKKNGWIKNF